MNKVLILHTSAVDLEVTVNKVKKVNSKNGPFDYCIIFSDKDIYQAIRDFISDDLPVFILFNSETNFPPCESVYDHPLDKIINFHGYGVYKLENGLTVAYLTYNADNMSSHISNIKEKLKSVAICNIDILITYEWGRNMSEITERFKGLSIVDTIAEKFQPKYHFSFSDTSEFVEYGPFIWGSSGTLSRFLNVPQYGKGRKWAYAFQIDPSKPHIEVFPGNILDNPYEITCKKRQSSELLSKTRLKKDAKKRKILPEMCHFCFYNKDLQDHMIISINDKSYVTIAKGPLSLPSGDMPFSGHCLVIPIEHIPKLNNNHSPDARLFESQLYKEMIGYEKSIITMNYRKFGMCSIVFEINSERSIHYHKQIVPIPKHLILKFQNSLDRQCHYNNERIRGNAKLNFKKYKIEDLEFKNILDNSKSNYIQFSIYETSEVEPRIFLAQFQVHERLDLQFGRRVLAYLLNLPKRVKWDSPECLQTPEEETSEVEKFQKAYRDYDIASN